jgi:hypothetical protein
MLAASPGHGTDCADWHVQLSDSSTTTTSNASRQAHPHILCPPDGCTQLTACPYLLVRGSCRNTLCTVARHQGDKRERARRETRRRFEQWAHNPECHSNVVSAVYNVKMGAAARRENPDAPRAGQSVFALLRGQTFEAGLIQEDASLLLESLKRAGVLGLTSNDFADHRWKDNGGPLPSLDAAVSAGREMLVALANGAIFNGVVSSFSVRIPRGIMLPEANLIVDVLAVEQTDDVPVLRVGEIKTYPDQAGHTSRANLATARAQMGLYVHALEVTLDGLGLTDRVKVDSRGFLVLTYPGSNRPSIRANEDLTFQRERARRGFELMEESAQTMHGAYGAGDEETDDEALLDLVLNAATSFQDSCIAFCERAHACYERAMRDGRGVVLGDDVDRFLNGVRLDRAVELLSGQQPASEVESDLVTRLLDPLPPLP